MKIRLLESAKEDLREGFEFYEAQTVGLGDYFLDCIQSDVQSLIIYAGIHESSEGFYRKESVARVRPCFRFTSVLKEASLGSGKLRG